VVNFGNTIINFLKTAAAPQLIEPRSGGKPGGRIPPSGALEVFTGDRLASVLAHVAARADGQPGYARRSPGYEP
jgi:hypothetical protein